MLRLLAPQPREPDRTPADERSVRPLRRTVAVVEARLGAATASGRFLPLLAIRSEDPGRTETLVKSVADVVASPAVEARQLRSALASLKLPCRGSHLACLACVGAVAEADPVASGAVVDATAAVDARAAAAKVVRQFASVAGVHAAAVTPEPAGGVVALGVVETRVLRA